MGQTMWNVLYEGNRVYDDRYHNRRKIALLHTSHLVHLTCEIVHARLRKGKHEILELIVL